MRKCMASNDICDAFHRRADEQESVPSLEGIGLADSS